MSVFGGMEDNAPDGDQAWGPWGSPPPDSSLSEQLSEPEPESTASIEPDHSSLSQSPLGEPTASGPDIFGQSWPSTEPQAALLSDTHARKARPRRRLIVTVTKIEPTTHELIVWFDVAATLPRFRSTYKDVRRTHHEMQRFANHLRNSNPECFVPALPSATNSVRDVDEKLVRLQRDTQRWFDRVTRSALLTRDEEFLYFVEAVTGYVPVVKIRPPTTGLARLMSKQRAPPPDDVEALREFRPQAKQLYRYAEEARTRIEKLSRGRRELSAALLSFSQQAAVLANDANTVAPSKTGSATAGLGAASAGAAGTGFGLLGSLSSLGSLGDTPSLGSANSSINGGISLPRGSSSSGSTESSDGAKSIGVVWDSLARVSRVQADTELKKYEIQEATLGDTLQTVGHEAYNIKETLTNRHFLINDLMKSQQATKDKHARATQLRGASDISPVRVDEAIVQLEGAAQLEKRLTTTVRRVSDNLVAEKRLALARIEADLLDAIAEYAREQIGQDRRILAAWETARPEVRAADPRGGLSRLGRETVGEMGRETRRQRYSQGHHGDAWSDRGSRARDSQAVPAPEQETPETFDRKAVVSMLARRPE